MCICLGFVAPHHQYTNTSDKYNNNRQFISPKHFANCLSKSDKDYYLGYSPVFNKGKVCSPLCRNIITLRSIVANFSKLLCAEGRPGRLCGTCNPGYGVPINQLNKCVHCDQDPILGWVIYVLTTLTSNSYCQIVCVVCPSLTFNLMSKY